MKNRNFRIQTVNVLGTEIINYLQAAFCWKWTPTVWYLVEAISAMVGDETKVGKVRTSNPILLTVVKEWVEDQKIGKDPIRAGGLLGTLSSHKEKSCIVS